MPVPGSAWMMKPSCAGIGSPAVEVLQFGFVGVKAGLSPVTTGANCVACKVTETWLAWLTSVKTSAGLAGKFPTSAIAPSACVNGAGWKILLTDWYGGPTGWAPTRAARGGSRVGTPRAALLPSVQICRPPGENAG